jgi:hypothetical protein
MQGHVLKSNYIDYLWQPLKELPTDANFAAAAQ